MAAGGRKRSSGLSEWAGETESVRGGMSQQIDNMKVFDTRQT